MPRLVGRTMRRRNTRHHVAGGCGAVLKPVANARQLSRIAWQPGNGRFRRDADLVSDVQVHHFRSGSHVAMIVAGGAIYRCNDGTVLSTRPAR